MKKQYIIPEMMASMVVSSQIICGSSLTINSESMDGMAGAQARRISVLGSVGAGSGIGSLGSVGSLK